MKIFNQGQWGSGDSNPDALRHQILNLARLPVPALPHENNMILSLVVFTTEVPRTIIPAPPVLNYQPDQRCCPDFSPRHFVILVTDGAEKTFLLGAPLTFTIPKAAAPSTLLEYVSEVVP